MIFKDLFRRKGRTFLTVSAIAIGVAVIIALDAMARGVQAGYNSFITGSKADLVLSQSDSVDISASSLDESIGLELASISEVDAISWMLGVWFKLKSFLTSLCLVIRKIVLHWVVSK